MPLTLVNGTFANVNLQAPDRGRPATNGGTLAAQSRGRQQPDDGRNRVRRRPADDATQAATSTSSRSSRRRSPSRRRRPSSTTASAARARARFRMPYVEYTITVANSSTTTAANGHRDHATRSRPTRRSRRASTRHRATSRSRAARPRPASRRRRPTRTPTAACRSGGNLVVGGAALGSIAAGATATVRFRVRIN